MRFQIYLNVLFFAATVFASGSVADSNGKESKAVYKLLPISPEERLVRPYRELAYSPNDIKEVRRLAKAGVNSQYVKEILASASKWMSYSDEELTGMFPDSKALYAIASAGDPKVNQAWPWFGRSDGVCSVDKPGQVKSPFTGDIYGIQKPGEEYYDDGSGWVRPSDGKRFYFKGIWNSYINTQLHYAVENLSIGYMLTGDPAMARRALMILDILATDRTKRPKVDGVCDYCYEMTPDKAFFSFVGNLANERTVYTGLALDLLANASYASQPSSLDPNVTVFDNIRKHYFSLYEIWYLEARQYLQNHALMLLANMTMQGVLFGREDYLRTAIEGTYAFLDGTINRDGDYYELAGGYGNLGRGYGGVMVTLLRRYDPNRYENSAAMPKPADYPHNLNLGNDPRWFTYCTDMLFKLTVAGHSLQYGDSNCDRSVLLNKTDQWLAKRQSVSLLMINGMVSSPERKKYIAELYWSMRPEDRDVSPLTENVLLYGLSMWQMPQAAKPVNADKGVPLDTDLMPAKRICILRGGEGENSRALFIRGGNNASHGHDDQMALVPYGNGMVLAGEYGYKWGVTDSMGWGSRAIAHNMAVVNKDLPASYYFKGRTDKATSPSSDITGYLPVGPAQFIEMNNPDMWKAAAKNTQEYRRTAWLIDIDAEHYYFVDMFQIIGGYVHDYAWSAPYDDNESNATFKVAGVNPQPQPGIWTLAALEQQYRDVTWNKPGQSWGERLYGMTDGRVKDIGLNDTPAKDPDKWNPPPGNGYGMIWDVKTDKTRNDWTAVWKLQDNKHYLRTDIFNFDGMEAITGCAPTLNDINKHYRMVIGRREQTSGPLHSRYANITQVGEPNSWPLQRVEKLAVKTSGDENDTIALSATMTDGTTDYILASRKTEHIQNAKINMDARRGFARIDKKGQLIHLAMQEGTLIEAGGWKLQADSEQFRANIINVKAGWNENTLTINKTLPVGDILGGSMVLITSPSGTKVPYAHNDYYYIEKIESADNNGCTLVFEKQSLIATRLHIDSIDVNQNKISAAWPNEMATWPGTFELNGKMVAVQDRPEQSTIIRSYLAREVKVLDANGFKKGDYLDVYVAKSADILTIPTTVTLTRQENGRYLLRTNTKATLTTAAAVGTKLMAQVGDESPQILATANENKKLQAVIDPVYFKSGKIQLWMQTQ